MQHRHGQPGWGARLSWVTRYRNDSDRDGPPNWPWPVFPAMTNGSRVTFAQDFLNQSGNPMIGSPRGRSGKRLRNGIFAVSRDGRSVLTLRENVMPDQIETSSSGETVTFEWPSKLVVIDGSRTRVLPTLQPPPGWKLSGDYVALWVG